MNHNGYSLVTIIITFCAWVIGWMTKDFVVLLLAGFMTLMGLILYFTFEKEQVAP